MKPILITAGLLLFLTGCDIDSGIDTEAPPPPQGIITISLDNAVELRWFESQAEDVRGYRVWVCDRYNGRYLPIGSTSEISFIDYDAANGVTCYYAVSAFDYDDNESELSTDVVYDTPRPEGYNIVLANLQYSPNVSGYDFSEYAVMEYDNYNTDFFFENINGRNIIYVWDKSDIQDMGYTGSLDDISCAPAYGWSPSKMVEAIVGHTYVIWTWDDHYAKIRVKEAGISRLVFDWAYQTAEKNPELKISRTPSVERKPPTRSLSQK